MHQSRRSCRPFRGGDLAWPGLRVPGEGIVAPGTAQRGWGSRVPCTAHRKIHLHPAMLGMWKLQRAQKHLLTVTTELPSEHFPVKSRLPALFALLVRRLPAEPRGFRGALRSFGACDNL